MSKFKVIRTIKLKITSHTSTLDTTLDIYRKALSFFINTANNEWETIKCIKGDSVIKFMEAVTHRTAQHPNPKYDFDKEFYKFPSYLRRACIMEAVGYVGSYHSNLAEWEAKKKEKGKKFHKKKPSLQSKHNSFPVLYKNGMFLRNSSNAKIKVFKNNDWVWIEAKLSMKNLKKFPLKEYKELNPMLVKDGKKYFLHIPFKKYSEVKEEKNIKAVGIDLGLTNSAVCSALSEGGTVAGRLFINQPVEKDRLYRAANRVAKANRNTGISEKPNLWRAVNNLQKQIVEDTSNRIVQFAEEQHANVIVFEYLNRMHPKGFYGARRLRFKLQFWAKKKIIRRTKEKAKRFGIRTVFVNPKGTSALAFDGSGKVLRNAKKDLCTFQKGKVYHADLNASYNIGARYHISCILKPLPETVRLQLQAKVPDAAGRTSQTLSSLIRLQKQ